MAALIAASVALGTFDNDFAPIIEEAKKSPYASDEYKDELNKVLREIRGPTSTVIAITEVAIMIEAAVIFTRFFNIEFVNANIKTLLCAVSIITSYLRSWCQWGLSTNKKFKSVHLEVNILIHTISLS